MLSTTGEYALRAAVFLAQSHPQPKTSAEIAEATQVPASYLSKILQGMSRRGLLASQRGIGGGFHLATDPESISVYDVLSAVEAPLPQMDRCPLQIGAHTDLCPLHRLIHEAIRVVEEAFRKATLGSLLRSTKEAPALCAGPALPTKESAQ